MDIDDRKLRKKLRKAEERRILLERDAHIQQAFESPRDCAHDKPSTTFCTSKCVALTSILIISIAAISAITSIFVLSPGPRKPQPDDEFILNCADPNSRAEALTKIRARTVINCCCMEFFQLEAIDGDLSIQLDGQYDNKAFTLGSNLQVIWGNLHISAHTLTAFHFGRVSKLAGNVTLELANLKEFSFDHVKEIDGDLTLHLQGPSKISFGNMRFIKGRVMLPTSGVTAVLFDNLQSLGGLNLRSSSVKHLNLGHVEVIHGTFSVVASAVETIDMGDITTIDGDFIISFSPIKSLHFKNIKQVVGSILIDNTQEFNSVSLEKLEKIGENLVLSHMSLQSINFGNLTELGGTLDLSFNKLSLLDFDESGLKLTEIRGDLNLNHNDMTSGLKLLPIKKVDGELDLQFDNQHDIDCQGVVAKCVSAHTEANLRNCPKRCSDV